MAFESQQTAAQSQRMNVSIEGSEAARRVKICLESHDDVLGWYTASSLCMPLHQLPLLEQALAEAKSQMAAAEDSSAKIIPFPGMSSVLPE